MSLDKFDPISTALDGTMLIEASAGTGKTYSLMHLILRLLVEKEFELNSILVVTFTKAATYELKTRLRQILTEMTERLAESGSDPEKFESGDQNQIDQLKEWAVNGITPAMVLDRLTRALLSIDDAQIFTIHGFCQRMLKDYVFSSQGAYDVEFGDGNEQLRSTMESFLRKSAPAVLSKETERCQIVGKPNWNAYLDKTSIFKRSQPAASQARFIRNYGPNGEIAIGESETDVQNFTEKFLDEAPRAFVELKRTERIFTFDDLLAEMEERVAVNHGDNEFVKEIRKLFKAALIDEFQDTDPLQYSIFKQLFIDDKDSKRPVIFVGDPKQSIYSFRNADLETYLQAGSDMDRILELRQNFRSTPGIVEAVSAIFNLPPHIARLAAAQAAAQAAAAKEAEEKAKAAGKKVRAKKVKDPSPDEIACGSPFLDPRIGFSDVDFNDLKLPLMEKLPDGSLKPVASFAFWSNGLSNQSSLKDISKTKAAMVAEDIAQLLTREIYIGNRRLRPSDIAILCATRPGAEPYLSALRERGIKCSFQRKDGVNNSKEYEEIQRVITAMADTKNQSLVSEARSTKIFGETLSSILEDAQKALNARVLLEEAAAIYEKNGIFAAFSKIFEVCGTEDRLLTEQAGERILTNYQHILELLYKAGKKAPTLQALLRVMEEPTQGEEADEDQLTLRRETDADVVRIETIHSSKGLQYPVVYLADAEKGLKQNKAKNYIYSESTAGAAGRKQVFCLEASALPPEVVRMNRGEGTRLEYVALTRPTHRLVVPFFVNFTKNGIHGGQAGGQSYFAHVLTGAEKGAPYIVSALTRLNEELSPTSTRTEIVRKALADSERRPPELSDQAIAEYIPFEVLDTIDEYLEESIQDAPKTVYQRQRTQKDDQPKVGDWKKTYQSWGTSSFTGLVKNLEETPTPFTTDEASEAEDQAHEALREENAAASTALPHSKTTAEETEDGDLLAGVQADKNAAEFGTEFHKLMELIFTDSMYSTKSVIQQQANKMLKMLPDSVENPNEYRKAASEDLITACRNILNVKFLKEEPDFCLNSLIDQGAVKIPEYEFLISVGVPTAGRKRFSAQRLSETLARLDRRFTSLRLSDIDMKGYLTGSIDLAFKVDDRFYIIDWKTNRIGEKPTEYTQEAVAQKMDMNHYRLQYLIYLVALKRLIESRTGVENGYEHIGGAAYFFVRGIREDNPEQGIIFDRPTPELIDCVDDFLMHGFDEGILEAYAKQIEERP